MSNDTSISENISKTIQSNDEDAIIELLDNLNGAELSDEDISSISTLFKSESKGLRNAASNFLVNNPHPKAAEYVVPFISSPEISLRNLAGDALIRIGSRGVEAIISYLVKSNNDDDKKFLIDVLGLIGDKAAAVPIIETMEVSNCENVVLACIEGLGNIGCYKAVGKLVELYDQNELYKTTIIEAFGKIGSTEALDFITTRYENEDPLVKFSMIESLGKIGNEDTFFFLIGELNKISGPLVWPVLEAIYNLKEKYALDIPFDERMKKSIVETIYSADLKYKIVAANLVNIFDDAEIIQACLTMLGEDPVIDEIVKPKFFDNSIGILSKIHTMLTQNPKNLYELISLTESLVMNEPDFKSQINVVDLQKLTEAVSNLLSHPDENIRSTATNLLFSLGTETAMLFADQMLNDENMWNRLRLIDILEGIETDESSELLVKLAQDPEEMISERAKEILSQRQITIE